MRADLKLEADQDLLFLIDYITMELDALEEAEQEDGKLSEYASGRKAALVECLEIVQQWEDAEENGLDWDIEGNFPV